MPPNALSPDTNTTRAKPHVCHAPPDPTCSLSAAHEPTRPHLVSSPRIRSHSPASWQQPRWTPPQTAGPLSQPSSCMHRCHSTSELDRPHMTASTTTMAKVRTVRVDPTSYTSRGTSAPDHCKHGSEAVWLKYTQAKHQPPICPPDRRCYCSAWFPSQHLCRRRRMRTATSRKPTSTPPGRRATRQASRDDRPHGVPRRRPARRPASIGRPGDDAGRCRTRAAATQFDAPATQLDSNWHPTVIPVAGTL